MLISPDRTCPAGSTSQSTEIDQAFYVKTKPLVFLHIPKTGGTSIGTLIRNVFGDANVLRLRTEDNDLRTRLAGAFAGGQHDCIDGHLPILLLKPYLNQMRIFTILRDPVDRVRSFYEFLLCHPHDALESYGLESGFRFENLIQTRNPRLYAQINNGMSRMLSAEKALHDHTDFMFWQPDEANVLSEVVGRLSTIEFGLLEDMQSTFRIAQNILDIPPHSVEYHENKTAKHAPSLSAENVRRIVQMNQVDIALYHTAKSMFVQRKLTLPSECTSRGSKLQYVLDAPPMTEICASDIPGRQGFHEFEPEGLAWLVADQTASLAFRVIAGLVSIGIRLYRVTGDYPVETTEISVNGRALDHEIAEQDDCWSTLRTKPFKPAAGVNVMTLKPPFSVPARFLKPDSLDQRYLSVALGSICFYPA